MTPSGGLIWASANLSASKTFSTLYAYGAWFTYSQAQSACPTNWRLPTAQEYRWLIGYTGTNVGNGVANGTYTSVSWTSGSGAGTGGRIIPKLGGVLYFPNAGYTYGSPTVADAATLGVFWASETYTGSTSYRLAFSAGYSTGYLGTADNVGGLSVRCVRDCYRGYAD